MACGSSTAKSHDLCTVIFVYTLIYDRKQEKYDHLRPYMGKIRLLTVSIFRRISSYTVTNIYDRNTITCFMTKYGRIRSAYGMYTVVYDTAYARLRPYAESVAVDLGMSDSTSLHQQLQEIHKVWYSVFPLQSHHLDIFQVLINDPEDVNSLLAEKHILVWKFAIWSKKTYFFYQCRHY